jgi:hypothetical protein
MRVREHPGFLDGWPAEPSGAFGRSYVAPLDRDDILTEVYLRRTVSSDEPNVVLRTLYRGGEHTRNNRVGDQEFAEELVRFLGPNVGKTIGEIGEMEIAF